MKIALFGYGKMGKEIEQIALSRGHEIAQKQTFKNAMQPLSSPLRTPPLPI
jgi:4-hydroxy-tetrahydrodipicolinate reductase